MTNTLIFPQHGGIHLALQERIVSIPGFKSVQQVKDNAGAMKFGTLTDSYVKEIQSIVGKYELKV